jgi:hypothetical protein
MLARHILVGAAVGRLHLHLHLPSLLRWRWRENWREDRWRPIGGGAPALRMTSLPCCG